MKGLEAAEKKISELERTKRIDAEFFEKRHLALAERLNTLKCSAVPSVASVSDGNHFSISDSFCESGVPYYRGQDVVGHFFIEQASPVHITREAYEQKYMKRSHLKQGDVLLSIIGTIGELSLVKTRQEATCSCKLAILRPFEVESSYLAAFLGSHLGHLLCERWKRGAVQMGLLLEDMDQIRIPRWTERFESSVSKTVDVAYQELESRRFFWTQLSGRFSRNSD